MLTYYIKCPMTDKAWDGTQWVAVSCFTDYLKFPSIWEASCYCTEHGMTEVGITTTRDYSGYRRPY